MTNIMEMMEMAMMLMVVSSGKSVSLLTGLLFSGHYDHIIGRSVIRHFWMLLYPKAEHFDLLLQKTQSLGSSSA